jgi:hypothetical protein
MAESPDERKKRAEAQRAAQAAQKIADQAAKAERATKAGAPTVATKDWASEAVRKSAAPGSTNPLTGQPATTVQEEPAPTGGPPGEAVPGQYGASFAPPTLEGTGPYKMQFAPPTLEQAAQGGSPYAVKFGPQSLGAVAQGGSEYATQFAPPTLEQAAQGSSEYQVSFAPPPLSANPLTQARVFARAINRSDESTKEAADKYRDRNASPEERKLREQQRETYRNATPEQREQLRKQYGEGQVSQWERDRDETPPKNREEYRNALRDKVASARDETRKAGPNPLTEGQKMDKYREHLKRQGIPVDTIGNAALTLNPDGTPGLVIPSPAQEYAAVNEANHNSRIMRNLENQERMLSTKKDAESIEARNRLHAERMRFGHETGFFDPLNPKAGLNMNEAVRRGVQRQIADERLARQRSTLPAVAQQQIEAVEPPIPPAPIPASVQTQAAVQGSIQELADMGLARERLAREQWLEQLRRQQAQVMGRYAYAY